MSNDFFFLAMLPQGTSDPSMLRNLPEGIEPCIDLNYGDKKCKEKLLDWMIAEKPRGLTVFLNPLDSELTGILEEALPESGRVIFTGKGDYARSAKLIGKVFQDRSIPVGFEVEGLKDAESAIQFGADFLMVSGLEAGGAVSSKTTLILVEELAGRLGRPLIVRGGLGPLGAAGAYAAGCSGCILDSQLLLLDCAPVPGKHKEWLSKVSPLETRVLGTFTGEPYRLLAAGDPRPMDTLEDREWTSLAFWAAQADPSGNATEYIASLHESASAGFSENAVVLPVGQGLCFAQDFARRGFDRNAVFVEYLEALQASVRLLSSDFVFQKNSKFAQLHGIECPIIQGPMSRISNDTGLCRIVSKYGGLPVIAKSGSSLESAVESIADFRSEFHSKPVGLGIIGFGPLEQIEEQISSVVASHPDLLVIAGASVAIAKRFTATGVPVYAHAPSDTIIESMMEAGVDGLILEGHEAGGHVGSLCSSILWEVGVNALLRMEADRLSDISLVLAGGLLNARGTLMAAAIVGPLHQAGLSVGLQLGTPYMLTDDAVDADIISDYSRNCLLSGTDTLVLGKSVNLPARWLKNRGLEPLVENERRLRDEMIPIEEKKRSFESTSQQTWRQSVHAENNDPSPVLMCGQSILIRPEIRSIQELHEELTTVAEAAAAELLKPESGDNMKGAIAVIGMGGIFPDANSIDEFWENIVNGVSSITEVPEDRIINEALWGSARGVHGTSYSRLGAFVRGFKKDPVKYRIPPTMAETVSQSVFMALESVEMALKDSGYFEQDFPRDTTGVFMGAVTGGPSDLDTGHAAYILWPKIANILDSLEELAELSESEKESLTQKIKDALWKDLIPIGDDSCPGACRTLEAGWINNRFNLGGGTMLTDMACASSLAAIDAAVSALRSGRLDMAIAGGSCGHTNAMSYLLYSSLGALSGKGSCPFDKAADGFILGEGVGVVLLKRLEDASRDGDKVYSVIRNVGISSDGKGRGITAPNSKGQVLALERAYQGMPFSPSDISLIEAHGTGTSVGDKEEAQTLMAVYGRQSSSEDRIGVGSVKSMIGHLRSSAGIAAFIKASMAIYKKTLPPTLNCESPIPELVGEGSPFYIIQETAPWTNVPLPRRAAVEAFGFGGANAHLILEEAPSNFPENGIVAVKGIKERVFFFRGEDRQALLDKVEVLRVDLETPGDFYAIAMAYNSTVNDTGPSLSVVASDNIDLAEKLKMAVGIIADTRKTSFDSANGLYFGSTSIAAIGKTAFLYPGQGAQYPGMAGDLSSTFPLFGDTVESFDEYFIKSGYESVQEILYEQSDLSGKNSEEKTAMLVEPKWNHPVMLVFTSALTETLKAAGIRPDAVAGHSLGEYAALYAAGVMDRDAASRVISRRAEDLSLFDGGTMASVSASTEIVQNLIQDIEGSLCVANKNCPSQTVISGDSVAIDKALNLFRDLGYECRQLKVANAFHSELLRPVAEGYREHLESIQFHSPKISVQSNYLGDYYTTAGDFAPRLRHILAEHVVSPVEFTRNIESLYADGVRFFIEVGPGGTLSSFVDNILGERLHWTTTTNHPKRSATLHFLHTLAFCAARGMNVDLAPITDPPAPLPLHRSGWTSARESGTDTPEADRFLEKVFEGESSETVKHYLASRKVFLSDMIKLDFSHFSKSDVEAPSDSEPAILQAVDGGIERRIINIVSSKTGYPPEVIDIDLDIEVELGLDSIKQVDFLKAVSKDFSMSLEDYRVSTLRNLIEKLSLGSPDFTIEPNDDTDGKESSTPVGFGSLKTINHRWICVPEKAGLPKSDSHKDLAGIRILLLTGQGELGDILYTALDMCGARIFRLAPNEEIDSLSERFDVVLDTWSFGEKGISDSSNIQTWWNKLSTLGGQYLLLAQHLINEDLSDAQSTRWITVSTLGGSQGLQDIHGSGTGAGISLGISRTLLIENPDTFKRLAVDFEEDSDCRFVSDKLIEEIAQEDGRFDIGYVKGERYALQWMVDESQPIQSEVCLDRDSVVVAVGGATGVTFELCMGIARQYGSRIVLLGRSFVKEADSTRAPITFDVARNRILSEALESRNRVVPSEVEQLAMAECRASERSVNLSVLRDIVPSTSYVACDITDSHELRKTLVEIAGKSGKIDLILHGAVDESWKRISDYNLNGFIEMMKSRVLGAANLLSFLEEFQIKTFANVTSVAAFSPTEGQAAYCSGHIVSSLLTSNTSGTEGFRSINSYYGTWLDTGVAGKGNVTERIAAKGYSFIRKDDGRNFFLGELKRGGIVNAVFSGENPLPCKRKSPSDIPFLDSIECPNDGVAVGSVILDPLLNGFVHEHGVVDESIVPGVLILELIAETGRALRQVDNEITDIEDVEFIRAVRFPRNESRELQTQAVLSSEEPDGSLWINGEFFSRSVLSGTENIPEKRIHARCRIRLGKRTSAPPVSLPLVTSSLGNNNLDASPLWESGKYKKRIGMFRNVQSILNLSRDCAITTISGVGSLPPNTALGDFIKLDAMVMTSILPDFMDRFSFSSVFSSVRKITFYAQSTDSESVVVRSIVRERSDSTLLSDSELVDESGQASIRITGNLSTYIDRSVEYDLPESFCHYMNEAPTNRKIRGILGYSGALELGQIFIPAAHEAIEGQNDYAENTFNREELQRRNEFSQKKRRMEWSAGRIAAKDCVRRHSGAKPPESADIRIIESSKTGPTIKIMNSTVFPSFLSISHSSEYAVAAIADVPVGVDIERISPAVSEIKDIFAHENEIRILETLLGTLDHHTAATILWSVKEAIRKTIGTESHKVTDLILETAEQQDNFLDCVVSIGDNATIRCAAFTDDGYSYALCLQIPETEELISEEPASDNLLALFGEIVDISKLHAIENPDLINDMNLSSNDMLRGLSRIESRFRIRFKPEDYKCMRNLNDIRQAISRAKNDSGAGVAPPPEMLSYSTRRTTGSFPSQRLLGRIKESIYRLSDHWKLEEIIRYNRFLGGVKYSLRKRAFEVDDLAEFYPHLRRVSLKKTARKLCLRSEESRGVERAIRTRGYGDFLRSVRTTGLEYILERQTKGLSTIIVTIHTDHLLIVPAILSDAGVRAFYIKHRPLPFQLPGFQVANILRTDKGGIGSMPVLMLAKDELESGGSVLMTIDGGAGEAVNGEVNGENRRRLRRGTAILARETGAAVVPVVISWQEERREFLFKAFQPILPPLEKTFSDLEVDQEITAQISLCFEDTLKSQPEIYSDRYLKRRLLNHDK